MDPNKVLIVDEACDFPRNMGMAETLLTALAAPIAPLVPSAPLTHDERKAKEKADYWAAKSARKTKAELREERIMNLMVCPPCADHTETRRRAHLGPFVNNGRGLIHQNCPWQKGGML